MPTRRRYNALHAKRIAHLSILTIAMKAVRNLKNKER
jgi:hypothetical protein